MTNSPLSPSRKAAIRARAEQATPGPWAQILSTGFVCTVGTEDESEEDVWAVCETNDSPDDARFIAHAREDIPDLLAELDRLDAELARVRAVIEHLVDAGLFPRGAWLLVKAGLAGNLRKPEADAQRADAKE